MRWDRLFAELEAEADELGLRDRDAEIADRTRAELARTRWLDRVRAAEGTTVTFRLLGDARGVGRVRYVGADWVLLADETQDLLLPAHAVLGVDGLGSATRPPPEGSALRTWAAAWRVLARDRALVRLVRVDGSTLSGVPARVGADFVELAPPPDAIDVAGEPRSAVLVPGAAIAVAYAPRPDEP